MIDDASMDTKFDDFAKHYGPTPGRTDRAAYRDAIDASKNRIVLLLYESLGFSLLDSFCAFSLLFQKRIHWLAQNQWGKKAWRTCVYVGKA